MAYNFLNTTTYSNDPLAQGDYSAFLPSRQEQDTPVGSGFDFPEDSDLIEIAAAASDPEQAEIAETQSPSIQEEDLSEDPDPQVDWEILNSFFQQEPEAKARVRSYTPPPSHEEDDDEEETPAPVVKAPRGKVTPRIYQNGGEIEEMQRGGGVGRRFGSRFNSNTVDQLTEEGKEMRS